MYLLRSYSAVRALRKSSLCFAICLGGLVITSNILAQGEQNPTGVAGSFSGSIATGGGSFDPFERNASRSVTDIVVPGAVVPFTFTRIWNSRGTWRHNWQWEYEKLLITETGNENPPLQPNDLFQGYSISYPDGRVVKFFKPATPAHAPEGQPGTYTSVTGILDRFVIDSNWNDGHLFMADGSVLNFSMPGFTVTSLVDPHGRAVTFGFDDAGIRVTEPGGRWISIGNWPPLVTENSKTRTIRTSLGQCITETYPLISSGLYPQAYDIDTGIYSTSIYTALGAVTYNDVLDSTTNQPLQAQYVYKNVQPPPDNNYPNNPQRYAFNRLLWASDPMFEGPLQQIKYLYVDSTANQLIADPSRHCVVEERSATGADEVGTTVTRVETPSTVTWSQSSGYSQDFLARTETHGDNVIRTFSYYNPTSHLGQNLMDHATDFTNDPNVTERHEYDLVHLFQTPTKITDPLGNVTLQSLESTLGHILQETHPPTPDTSYLSWTYTNPPYYLSSATDELNRTITYTRNSTTHLVTHIDYPGGAEDFTYNSFGQVTDHRLASNAHLYQTFDNRGLRTSSYDSVHSSEITTYTYDDKDRLCTVLDPRGASLGLAYSVMFKYNGRHQVTEVHYPASDTNTDPTVTYTYDKWGHCTSITDEMGGTHTMTYDDYGRIISYTESLNAPSWNGSDTVADRTWNWTYERVRNGVTYAANTHVNKEWRTQTEPAFNAAVDRRRTIREYDVNNRLVSEQNGVIVHSSASTDTAQSETHSFEYDLNGNKKKYTDPLNRVTTYDYDPRNRLTTTTEPLNRITTTDYDAASNKTQVTFPDTKTQQWLDYDAFGQNGRFIDERNNTTDLTYQWGPMKKLATVKTHRTKDSGAMEDQLTTFTYDGVGRPLRTTFPDLTYEENNYQYGQLLTWRNRKAVLKSIEYDARNREIFSSWRDTVTPAVGRKWDDANRLVSLFNTNSTISYAYDDAGQVLGENDGPGQDPDPDALESQSPGLRIFVPTLAYYRYPDGAVANLVYPNGQMIRRDYTARGQLTAAGPDSSDGTWQQQLATYNYLADGKVNYEIYGNTVRTDFGYDDRGFTNAVNTTMGGAVLSNRTYYRDDRDRIYAWAKSNNTTNNQLENGRGDRYTYDAEGQLTTASYDALTPNATPTDVHRSDSFVYDQLGNRMGQNQIASLGLVTLHRSDNGLNQYLDWTPSPISYKPDGNLVQDGWITMLCNALKQPVWAWSPSLPGTGKMWFAYDPMGRCVHRWSDTAETYFYYDGWNLIQEGSTSDPAIADRIYVHGNRIDEIVADQVGSTWTYHHYDARGHCILLTGSSGTLVEQYDYDAFGKAYCYNLSGTLLTNGTASGNRFLFTGREWISDLKLYDFRNRMYQPELGRFIQPDPKEFEAGDYNLYRYCHNDPINNIDPTGLDPVVVSPEANALALQADSRNLTEMAANTYIFGLFSFEFSTTVYQNSQGSLSLSETRTDYHTRDVRPPENPQLTSVVETHSHTFNSTDPTTHSILSRQDVQRGNQKGRTEEASQPDGTRDRYKPSAIPGEQARGEGGIIERLNSKGEWEPLKGANTNLKDPSDHRNGTWREF